MGSTLRLLLSPTSTPRLLLSPTSTPKSLLSHTFTRSQLPLPQHQLPLLPQLQLMLLHQLNWPTLLLHLCKLPLLQLLQSSILLYPQLPMAMVQHPTTMPQLWDTTMVPTPMASCQLLSANKESF